MAVTSPKEYIGVARDRKEEYGENQLVYVSWDHHLLFAAAFTIHIPSKATFRELIEGPVTALIQSDPDAGKIEWDKVQWFLSNEPFTPDFDKSLEENGVGHKYQIRFATPGLNTVCGVD